MLTHTPILHSGCGGPGGIEASLRDALYSYCMSSFLLSCTVVFFVWVQGIVLFSYLGG